MRTVLVFSGMSLLLACTTPEQRQHDALMDVIEARVKLPEGARALSEYARHYAVDETGLIVGVYAPGYRAPAPDEGCEELLENMASRPVPCEEPEGNRLLSGQRQWVGNTDRLPLTMDGGCGVITVIYVSKAGAVKSATCNGVA
jgi:hypothetical protein